MPPRLLGIVFALLVAVGLVVAMLPGQGRPGGGYVRVDGDRMVDPDGQVFRVRGIGLGQWLVPEGYMFGFQAARSPRQIRMLFREMVGSEADNDFWRRWRDLFVREDDIAWLASAGINVIRIPFDYRLWTPEEHPGVWIDEGFRLVDRIVEWSARHGLRVMLDMHAAPCGQTGSNIDNSDGVPHLYDDPACVRRTGDVWERIARHYAGQPAILGYEIFNEPAPYGEGVAGPPSEKLESITRAVAARIRAVDPNHLIFHNAPDWETDAFPPMVFDPALVFTFHAYWAPPEDALIRNFLAFRERRRAPILMSESGENTDAWIELFRKLLEAHDVGWIFWPYKKMAQTTGLRRFDPPPYWNEIVAYQALVDRPARERLAQRPPRDHAVAALEGLLDSVTLARTKLNAGYARALGLSTP